MSTRNSSRQTARRRHRSARTGTTKPLPGRPLRFEPLEDRRLLALVTVDTLADTVDFNDGVTSLREAIFATNTVGGPDTIDFAPALTAGGQVTILLTQGELKITDSLTIAGPGADLLTIDASGNDPTPDVNNADGSRVFNIDDGNSAALVDVTLSGATLTGGDFSSGGGAIAAFENLNLFDSMISNNSAGFGAGIFSRNVFGSGGMLTITRSVIQDNSASFNGGGIFSNIGGTLTITSSVIQGNSASGNGGGIFARADAVALTILDSEIVGNTAGMNGDGLSFVGFRGQFEVADSVVSNNTAGGSGGGMGVRADTTTINRTAIRDNYAGSSGGGLRLRAVLWSATASSSATWLMEATRRSLPLAVAASQHPAIS